ncbi:PhzF family phenazine biosynthesis protein [uncultured Vibrio sp.]|uniref:PhzF family phenazine biosynthesis protein n=1 Tax=uncultured Vibrio sp. TaxID=114054 RepID=UPI0026106B94|nr:PhzF family phenazine biosynthesis protein [uncultured Vibrio sp.]
MEFRVELVKAFVANGEGGNPAGVVLDADKLSYSQRLTIAQTIGFPETAFVSRDTEADFKVSFFTITEEVDFCGHATLAAFSVMHKKGILPAGIYKQNTKAGLLEVQVNSDGMVILTQKTPEELGTYNAEDICDLIGLSKHLLEETNLPIKAISTGLADLIVAVPDGHLDSIRPNHSAIIEFCQENSLIGLHAFELCSHGEGLSARCRNFAPLVGIPEESATGSSSGALAYYLTKHVAPSDEFLFEQGRAMKCTSHIHAYVTRHQESVAKIAVGGMTKHVGQQHVVV